MLYAFECDTFDYQTIDEIALNRGVYSKLEILYVVPKIFQIFVILQI